MGKYQLDYKGMQQVERYHEKMQPSKNDKKHVSTLLKKLERRSDIDFYAVQVKQIKLS